MLKFVQFLETSVEKIRLISWTFNFHKNEGEKQILEVNIPPDFEG